jgi:hypothetical protein
LAPFGRERPVEEALGDALGRVRPRERPRVRRHADERRAVLDQALHLGREALAGQVGVEDHHRAAALGEVLRVGDLVVVGRERVRHEDRRHAAGGDLGERHRARAADDQVGRRVGLVDVREVRHRP